MERLIFHVDVNSAFLSWEAAKRVKEGLPDLREIPSCIGGDPKLRRSIVVAKSIPAKKYGVTTGEPVALALRKCPDLVCVPGDFALYQRCSRAFKEICASYAPAMESFSIDEVFLDMTGTHLIYPDPVAVAHEIKDKIRDELGFTVNVGIGTNKLLAKMASDFEKPDKVHTLFPEEIQKKMWPLPVSELFMVGRATAEKLRLLGIKTIGDLAKTDVGILTAHLKSHGKTIWEFANGIEGTPIDGRAHTENKGIGNMTTLSQDLSDKTEIFEVLRELAEKVAGRLRASGQQAGLVCVEIKYADFTKATHQMQLLSPTNVSDTIYRAACRLFEEVWKGYPVRLLGIRTSKLSKTGQQQMNLFDMAKSEKMQKLDKALDEIRERYGTSAVVRGSKMHVQRLGWDSEIPEDDF